MYLQNVFHPHRPDHFFNQATSVEKRFPGLGQLPFKT